MLRIQRQEQRSHAGWDRDLDLSPKPASGKKVTPETALQVSAVFGAVRLLSETIATLPVYAFERPDQSLTSTEGHGDPAPLPSWVVKPHPFLGWIDLLSQVMVSLLLGGHNGGDAFLAITRADSGSVTMLTPLDPGLVEVDPETPAARYLVNGKCFPSSDILHIPGMMLPGSVRGVSPIIYARETIGLSLAAQEYGAAFFGNSALPSGLVEVEGTLSDAGLRQMRESWNRLHRGSGNAARIAVLTEGAKFSKVSLSPEESQFLETRAFQVPDIARIFGVPPHLLADASGSTSWGSGLAEQGVVFAMHSLRPWVSRLEAAFTALARTEPRTNQRYHIKLSLDGLMRGSLQQRMEAYSIALQQGIYNLDEVRAFENLPPLPGGKGKVHRFPLNLGEVGQERVKETTAPPSPPSPPPPPEDPDQGDPADV